MRLHFLGTGTSAGVPTIACECEVCLSDDPRDTRLRTAGAITFTDSGGQDRTILIDCGPDLRQQALAHKLRRADAVLFTHNHVDHTFGVDELRRFNVAMGRAIDVYAEPHTMGFLKRVYAHIFEKDRNVNDSFVATLIGHEIGPDEPIDLFGLRVTPIRLLHGKLPVLGYRFDPPSPSLPGEQTSDAQTRGLGGAGGVAYCTDVSGVPPESWRHLEGLEVLVLDALRWRRHPTHLTIEQAIDVAQRVGAEKTYFVHMSHDAGLHGELEAKLPPNIFLAHDGLVLPEPAGREPLRTPDTG